MDLDLSVDQALLRDTVGRFVAEQVEPVRTWAEEGVPSDLAQALGELGLWGLAFASDDGGVGLGALELVVAVEALARGCGALGLWVGTHNAVGRWWPDANERQRAASGEQVCAWGEVTRAQEALHLPGEAGVAVHGAQVSLFRREGPPRVARPLGFVEVPWASSTVILEPHPRGDAVRVWLELALAATGLGLGAAALAAATTYAQSREQFQRPIADFQATQFRLADVATELSAARWLCYRAATTMRPGDIAMARAWATAAAERGADAAVQIHGGNGFVTEYPVERIYRDAVMLRGALGGRASCQTTLASTLLERAPVAGAA